MFKLNDKVIEIKTGTVGEVVEMRFDKKRYGVIFEGRENEVCWCSWDDVETF